MVAALVATDVSKRFGSTDALRGVSLRVPPGSITALVGPNGAGKSTLMKAWVGFERPSTGSVTVGGVDPWRHRGSALAELAYVPQTPSLYRDLTVADHIEMASAARPGFDRRIATQRLAALGIASNAAARRLSGGQAAQVGLSLALGTRAPVLLLDEPLASLDPLARQEFLAVLVDDVRVRGATVVMSSHVVSDIERACDRMVVLGAGRKLLDDDLANVLNDHRLESGTDAAARAIGNVTSRDGSRWSLVRSPDLPPSATSASASLEEIVLGYLISAKAGTD